MRIKFFGTEIYVSFTFAALITVMLILDKTGMILPLLFAVFMHETGHLSAMRLMGDAPKRIKLIPASVQITKSQFSGYKNDIIVSLSGPFVNVLLFFVFLLSYKFSGNGLTLNIALLNLIIGVFNLLPLKGLDGGAILYSVLCKYISIQKAETVLKIISLLSAVMLLAAAVILTLKGKLNISFYIMGIYLLVTTIIKS